MASIKITDEIIKALDNDDCVLEKILDFSMQLITTYFLKNLSLWYRRLWWFRSYLSGWRQFVTYTGVSSNTKTITCGVPQGSIFGPFLFFVLYQWSIWLLLHVSTDIVCRWYTFIFQRKIYLYIWSGINFDLVIYQLGTQLINCHWMLKRHTICYLVNIEAKKTSR